MATSQPGAAAEWRVYWPVVLSALLGMALTSLHVYSIGLFIEPLEAEFNWSRSEIVFGYTVLTITGACVAPFVGMLIDRLGPRRPALIGICLFCGLFAVLSLTTSSIYMWWSLWFLLAVGGMTTKPTVWTAAVSSLFEKGRGLALAVMLCGTGIGSSFYPVIANALINEFGWRGGFVGLGLMAFLVIFPVAYFCLSSAKDNARRKPVSSSSTGKLVLPGLTAKEALLSWRFFKLALAGFTVTLAIVSFVMNLVPIMSSNGFTRASAASIAGAVGITSIIGRLATGVLLDRFNGNVIGGVVVLAPILSCLCFIYFPTSPTIILLSVILIGLSLGAELDVVSYLATRHFGMRSYGLIFGCIVSLWSVANGVGPFIVNYIYDVTGSYQGAIWGFIPMLLIASVSLFAMGEYPVFEQSESADKLPEGSVTT